MIFVLAPIALIALGELFRRLNKRPTTSGVPMAWWVFYAVGIYGLIAAIVRALQ